MVSIGRPNAINKLAFGDGWNTYRLGMLNIPHKDMIIVGIRVRGKGFTTLVVGTQGVFLQPTQGCLMAEGFRHYSGR